MTKDMIIDIVGELCDNNGYKYLIQIDDGKRVQGEWNVTTNSKLHEMCKAIANLSDSYEETTVEKVGS